MKVLTVLKGNTCLPVLPNKMETEVLLKHLNPPQ